MQPMWKNAAVLALVLVGVVALTAGAMAIGAQREDGEAQIDAEVAGGASDDTRPAPEPTDAAERERRARERQARIEAEFPLHGMVTRTQIIVRAEADPDSNVLGWLRAGAHVRLAAGPVTTPTCSSGWHRVHPSGWVCLGTGVDMSETPPAAELEVRPNLESPLPYTYYFVKEPQVPEYHLLPSRDDQRAALAHSGRYIEFLRAGDERRAARLRAGELPGEPPPPPEVARYLDHGFFVASTGIEVRSSRRFVRTVRGSYIKEAQLEERTGAQFHGVEIPPEGDLPVAWAIRSGRPLVRITRDDGSTRMQELEEAPVIDRLSQVQWLRRERIGGRFYHVLQGPDEQEHFLRDWFVAVAERHDAPRGIEADEPWVHVDLTRETLVLYRGERPIYATLVSTGVEGHDTPVGEFTIRRKLISDTMANLGQDASSDDRYRIEDVPWTQYFEGSIALHAAFWHAQYGIPRSHGCVNLAPADAQYVFRHTWPEIPEGWHGVSTEGTRMRGSRVLVTR